MRSQATSHLLMIRPARFGFNEETADSNAFQDGQFALQTKAIAQESALREFDEMVVHLRSAGVDVLVVEDTPEPYTPDSIFPNNWVSFHYNGTVILYPMQAENRRPERRRDILDQIGERFFINRVIDLTPFEQEGKYLEGTGSMVLDRRFKIAYVCPSPRTHEEVLQEFSLQMNYEIVRFQATDEAGQPIYHTNVMLCIADQFALICLEAIADLDERLMVRTSLEQSGRQIVEITMAQMKQFAGNMLQVKSQRGGSLLVMSTSAYESLTPGQIDSLDDHCDLMHVDLPIIEGNGGGSARCMMAEIHLPVKY